jgi:D-glycero-beta-D-manno-heptose 1-phosphate adenylyltransferase
MIDTRTKVRLLPEALTWRARQAGPVVFTNGVFDLLHPGHVELLEAARREGSALIVGVNSDASARRLGKGPDRPVNLETARAPGGIGRRGLCGALRGGDAPRSHSTVGP